MYPDSEKYLTRACEAGQEPNMTTQKGPILPGKVAGLDNHTLSRSWHLWALSSLTVLTSACPLQAFISEAYAFLNTPLSASPLKKPTCEETVSQSS